MDLRKGEIRHLLPDGCCFHSAAFQKPGGFLFTGAVLYALCQYADFSGGIDMMMAVSHLFGVKMDDIVVVKGT